MNSRKRHQVRIDIRYLHDDARPKVDELIAALRKIGYQVEHPEWHHPSMNIHCVKMKNMKKPKKSEDGRLTGESNEPYTKEDALNDIADLHKKKVPIKRGCSNAQCFCTGACNEIIGYRDRLPGEQFPQ